MSVCLFIYLLSHPKRLTLIMRDDSPWGANEFRLKKKHLDSANRPLEYSAENTPQRPLADIIISQGLLGVNAVNDFILYFPMNT